MPPIPIRSIMMQKKSAAAKPASDGSHTISGRISNLHEHHSGKHVAVTVVHGRRKGRTAAQKKRDEKNGFVGNSGMFDDRPRSEVHIPKAQAKQFHMGQRVNLSLSPVEQDPDDAGDMGEGD